MNTSTVITRHLRKTPNIRNKINNRKKILRGNRHNSGNWET